ncbi:hypothetical protein SAMN05421830_104150 [Desulfomicrobium norvegicum]|uniref:Uncharacterized protein n=1 Tax=Desulfomicrobium norvegicum (strain DSM 1741 / NCIMB 8310) TaxID=52561 RepID=A0A8G2C2C0_DESNO|nr:hypothetical protein [Desulfomicrobium norvegicum]SFL64009.1 hypothetical protein SAMN05421830_104150 [Desulfomicrobium norvegicum]
MNIRALQRAGVLFLVLVLAGGGASLANELKQPTQAEIAQQVVVDDSMKAVMKSFLKAGLTYDSLPAGAGAEVRAALEYWKGNKDGLKEFAGRLGKLAGSNREELLEMIRSKKLREFAVVALDESASGAFHNVGPDGLKKLVAYSGDTLDDAGVRALSLLNRVEDAITATGKVPAHLADDLKTALNQLSPSQLRAARKLLSEKGTKAAVKDYLVKNPGVIGTFVDGVFVLAFDVPALLALSDAEEAAASATGTGFGFAAQTAGTAATAALGGGFLPGLVVSWTSSQVKELVTEMIMLQYDRANAAMKAQWASMELRMNAIRGMLKVDELLKSGDVSKAADYLAKVERYAMEQNFPSEGIFEKIQDLKGIVAKAEKRGAANQIIARARVPYMYGYRLASQGRNLSLARTHVEEALAVLQEALGRYPELKDRVSQVQGLIAQIDSMIAQAPPLGQATVSGPDSVAPGEVAHFEVSLTGGIPDYQPVDMSGHGLSTGAVYYWEAPAEPGVQTVTFRIRDDSGKIAEVAKDVEVAGETQGTEVTGEIWEILKHTPKMRITMPLKTFEMIITPGGRISFPVDYKSGDFQIKGTGALTLSKDGRMIELLSMDTESIDIKSGEVWGQEELRVGPFKLHTADKRNHDAPSSITNAYRLYYVYASGFKEDRGTLRMGEAEFGYDSSNNFVKQGFKWHEVQRLDTTSNYYSHFETIYIHFLENEE